MSDSKETNYRLTTEEAVKFIKRAPSGVKFALHVSVDLPVGEYKCFSGSGRGYVELSRAVALRIVSDMMSKNLESRGARIPLTLNEYVIGEEVHKTIWIG